MRLFPSDWLGFLDDLAGWGDLSITARRTFLDGIAPGLSLDVSRIDPGIAELREAGYLSESRSRGYLGVAERHAQFHQVMKTLQKYPLFDSPGLASLCSYMAEHYSPQERAQLDESLALLPNDLPRIAALVASVEWLQSALARRRPVQDAPGLETARTLLAFFSAQRDRIPLRDLEEYFPGIGREELCAGVRRGVMRAVVFLGLRRADLEPLVGVWPGAARRLRRLSVILAPEPVPVVQVFRHPFLVEDMTTLLASARVEVIPLRRGDDRPFSRFVEETAPMLLTLPEWLERLTGLSLEGRITLALQALRLAGLLEPGEPGSGAAPHLAPGRESLAWIRRPIEERCALAVRVFGEHRGKAPLLLDLLEEEWTTTDGVREELLPWIAQGFSSVPVSAFIQFADFAEYQAAIASPLTLESMTGVGTSTPADQRAGVGAAAATEEGMEELWKSFLGIFLGRCLLSLGGAEAGVTSEGKPGFRMNDTGRVLLGLPREGLQEERVDRIRSAELIVQPNFEIVFLSPSPGAEAVLGRFCQRIGGEVGVLFRLTRGSLLRAAAAGLEVEQALDALREGSRRPVPPNVECEIRGWMGEEMRQERREEMRQERREAAP